MKYTEILGQRISQLMLGTVQLGQKYGIANKSGQPSRDCAEKILAKAFESGINILDTAHGYGESEELIGDFLSSYPNQDKIIVETKPKHLDTDNGSIEDQINECLSASLKKLKLDCIDIYMLHKADNMKSAEVLDYLKKLREQGSIKHIGISIYTPAEAQYALSLDCVDVIQVPFNIFDQRLRVDGFLEGARKKGTAVFARSSFLQGLILMKNDEVPANLKDIIPSKNKLAQICEKASRTVNEVAFKFPLTQPGIISVLFGVDNILQLEQNLDVYNSPPLTESLIRELNDAFTDVPERLINPVMWRNS